MYPSPCITNSYSFQYFPITPQTSPADTSLAVSWIAVSCSARQQCILAPGVQGNNINIIINNNSKNNNSNNNNNSINNNNNNKNNNKNSNNTNNNNNNNNTITTTTAIVDAVEISQSEPGFQKRPEWARLWNEPEWVRFWEWATMSQVLEWARISQWEWATKIRHI